MYTGNQELSALNRHHPPHQILRIFDMVADSVKGYARWIDSDTIHEAR